MHARDRGFTLVETIIGTAILTCGVVALAHLMTVCASANMVAHHRTMSALFAQQKLEQLRAEPILDESGLITEYLDGDGAILCHGGSLCGGAVYLREWWVRLSAVAAPAVLVHVHVRRARSGGGDVHLITVRPRVMR
jgi:Tfp pilus assembly protein PilV